MKNIDNTPQSGEMSLFDRATEEYGKISEREGFIYSTDNVSLEESNAYYTGFMNAFELGFKSIQIESDQLEKENARLEAENTKLSIYYVKTIYELECEIENLKEQINGKANT